MKTKLFTDQTAAYTANRPIIRPGGHSLPLGGGEAWREGRGLMDSLHDRSGRDSARRSRRRKEAGFHARSFSASLRRRLRAWFMGRRLGLLTTHWDHEPKAPAEGAGSQNGFSASCGLLSKSVAALVLSLLLVGCSKSPDLIGAWQGTLDLPGTQLRIIFKIARGPNGALIGTLDSPDQGAKNIPMTIEGQKATAVLFKVPTIGGSYEGKIESGGAKMSGQWKQGMVALPLQLDRIDATKAAQTSVRKANPESVEANKKTGGKLIGEWEGTLVAGARLRLIFKITESPEGGLLGSLDSLDQGAKDIPITAISYDAPEIIFEVKTIGGEFAGSLTNAQLTGSWQQAGQSFFLALSKIE